MIFNLRGCPPAALYPLASCHITQFSTHNAHNAAATFHKLRRDAAAACVSGPERRQKVNVSFRDLSDVRRPAIGNHFCFKFRGVIREGVILQVLRPYLNSSSGVSEGKTPASVSLEIAFLHAGFGMSAPDFVFTQSGWIIDKARSTALEN